MNILFYIVSLLVLSAPQALTAKPNTEELVRACVKAQPGVSKESCQCMVKGLGTNSNVLKMFEGMTKKHGPKFKEKIYRELSSEWWTAEKYRKAPKNRRLNDEESAMLVISLNVSFPCMKQGQ